MSLDGIAGLVRVSQLQADIANEHAAADVEQARMAVAHRSRLDAVLASPSALPAEYDDLDAIVEVEYRKLDAQCSGNIEALDDQVSGIDVAIHELVKQLQTTRGQEQQEKDSAAAGGDGGTDADLQRRLEQAAQTYKDMLDSANALFR